MNPPAPPLDEQAKTITETIERLHALIDLIQFANTPLELERIHQHLKAEAETLNQLNRQLTDSIQQNKEKKNMKSKSWIIIGVLLMLLVFAGGVFAQEATLEVPTVEAFTPGPEETEPPIVVTVVITDVAPTLDPNVTPVPPDEEEPEPDVPPDKSEISNVVIIGVLVFVYLVLRLFGDVIKRALVTAGEQIPTIALPAIEQFWSSVKQRGDQVVITIPGTLDDEAYDEIKKTVDETLAEIKRRKETPSAVNKYIRRE